MDKNTSHFWVGNLLRYAAIFLVLILLIILIRAGIEIRSIPVTGSGNIEIKANGSIWQNNKKIGQFIVKNQTLNAQIRFNEPVKSEIFDYYGQLIMPREDLKKEAALEFVSIQGTRGFNINKNISRNSFILSLYNIYPDSFTYLSVDLKKGSLNIPLEVRFISWLINISYLGWAVFSLFLVLLSWLVLSLKNKGHRLRVKEEFPHPPESMGPLEMAILQKGYFDRYDLIALFYQCGEMGHLRIICNDKDVFLFRTPESETRNDLDSSLVDFLNIIAPVNESGVPFTLSKVVRNMNRNLFSEAVNNLYINTYNNLTNRGFVDTNPRILHLKYKTSGIIVQFMALFMMIAVYVFLRDTLSGMLFLGIAIYVVGYLIYKIGQRKIVYTDSGSKFLEQVLAFHNFLKSPKQVNIAGSGGYIFWQYLPYAISAGLVTQWLKRFDRSNLYIPKWYSTLYDIFLPETFIEQVGTIEKYLTPTIIKLVDPNVD